MAQRFEVKLTRPNGSVPWGFRLQGGADFPTPLSIQLVQPQSVAQEAELQANDGVLQINGVATETLDHEQAKAEIIRSGNEVTFLIMRGAVTTWRPKVTPMSELKPSELQTHTLSGEAPPVQRTSLAANKQPVQHVGSGHNRSARPFGGSTVETEKHISVRYIFPNAAGGSPAYGRNQLQQEYLSECDGVVPNVSYDSAPAKPQASPQQPGVMHAQYNTPMGIYSPNNINDSFNQQATVMKDEFGNMSLHDGSPVTNNNISAGKPVPQANIERPAQSAVLQAVQKTDQEDSVPLYKGVNIQSRTFKALEHELESGDAPSSVFSARAQAPNSVLPPGMRKVQAPAHDPNMKMTGPRWKQPTSKCYICDQVITGVFVKVKEHPIHADCLRCAQCRISLKNIGYIWVGEKIYCVQHARELTRPPGGGYTAYVIDAPDA